MAAPPGPEQMLRVARMLEQDGDDVGAVLAYREVLLAGEEPTAAEARRRLELLLARVTTGTPA